MIKESIEEKNRPDQKIIISQLKKQLDEKLRKLDDHYIITGTTDILGSLAMLNAIQPMEITAENKDLIADLESIIIQEDENLLAEQIEPEKKLNIILRILRYLKAKLKSLGSK